MKFKLKNPVTIYEVYQDPNTMDMIYRVRPIELSTLDDILDLGRTASYDSSYGYVNLFETEVEAVMAAYRRTTLSNTLSKDDSCDVNCDNCKEACCGDCDDCDEAIPEPSVEELFPMDEYPSKIVKFDTTETIRLFKRRPGQKPTANCAFITQAEADKFKHDSNIKSNYSLTRIGKPDTYKYYVEKYFD